MSHFIDKATPLALALFLSLIGIAATTIIEAKDILNETDPARRKTKARRILLSSLAPNLCLGAFSFDIWAITTIFAADQKALEFYNLMAKSNAVLLILLVHLFLYLAVLAWGGVVRTSKADVGIFETAMGVLAVGLCIVVQSY